MARESLTNRTVPEKVGFGWRSVVLGGSGGIRTHGTVPRTLVFKTRALNHSATLPCAFRTCHGPDRASCPASPDPRRLASACSRISPGPSSDDRAACRITSLPRRRPVPDLLWGSRRDPLLPGGVRGAGAEAGSRSFPCAVAAVWSARRKGGQGSPARRTERARQGRRTQDGALHGICGTSACCHPDARLSCTGGLRSRYGPVRLGNRNGCRARHGGAARPRRPRHGGECAGAKGLHASGTGAMGRVPVAGPRPGCLARSGESRRKHLLQRCNRQDGHRRPGAAQVRKSRPVGSGFLRRGQGAELSGRTARAGHDHRAAAKGRDACRTHGDRCIRPDRGGRCGQNGSRGRPGCQRHGSSRGRGTGHGSGRVGKGGGPEPCLLPWPVPRAARPATGRAS